MRTAPTLRAWPIWRGSSSFPLNLKTVLRAITFRSGSCESVLMRLSVKPSLRYSLFGSAVALTKGNTAMELTLWVSDFPRRKYIADAATAISNTAAKAAASILRDWLGAAAVGTEENDVAEA